MVIKRNNANNSNANQIRATPERRDGCPIPLLGGCTEGFPLPTEEQGGIRMICSNNRCQFSGQLMHESCMHSYEIQLMKVLSNLGSARGWTETQKWANLWEKKGLSLIQKQVRCLCGMGVLHRDIESEKKKQKTASVAVAAQAGNQENGHGVVAATAANGIKKKTKLPTLNVGGRYDSAAGGGNSAAAAMSATARRRLQQQRAKQREAEAAAEAAASRYAKPLPAAPTLAAYEPMRYKMNPNSHWSTSYGDQENRDWEDYEDGEEDYMDGDVEDNKTNRSSDRRTASSIGDVSRGECSSGLDHVSGTGAAHLDRYHGSDAGDCNNNKKPKPLATITNQMWPAIDGFCTRNRSQPVSDTAASVDQPATASYANIAKKQLKTSAIQSQPPTVQQNGDQQKKSLRMARGAGAVVAAGSRRRQRNSGDSSGGRSATSNSKLAAATRTTTTARSATGTSRPRSNSFISPSGVAFHRGDAVKRSVATSTDSAGTILNSSVSRDSESSSTSGGDWRPPAVYASVAVSVASSQQQQHVPVLVVPVPRESTLKAVPEPDNGFPQTEMMPDYPSLVQFYPDYYCYNYGYELFRGSSFFLGEFLLAERYLPPFPIYSYVQ